MHAFQRCDAGTISAIPDKLGATLTYKDGDDLPLGGIFLAKITTLKNNGLGMLCSNFIFLPSDSEITVHYSGGASNAAETALLTSKYRRIATKADCTLLAISDATECAAYRAANKMARISEDGS